MPTDAAQRAQAILRDGSQFQWYVIPQHTHAVADRRLWLFHLFAVAFWVHDLPTIRRKAQVVGALYAFDAACLVLFAGVLGWI